MEPPNSVVVFLTALSLLACLTLNSVSMGLSPAKYLEARHVQELVLTDLSSPREPRNHQRPRLFACPIFSGERWGELVTDDQINIYSGSFKLRLNGSSQRVLLTVWIHKNSRIHPCWCRLSTKLAAECHRLDRY